MGFSPWDSGHGVASTFRHRPCVHASPKGLKPGFIASHSVWAEAQTYLRSKSNRNRLSRKLLGGSVGIGPTNEGDAALKRTDAPFLEELPRQK